MSLEDQLMQNTRELQDVNLDRERLSATRLALWRALREQGVPDAHIAFLSGFKGPMMVTRALK